MTENTARKRYTPLTIKLAVLVTTAGLLLLSGLGLYFDHFLNKSFNRAAKTQIQHSFNRIAYKLEELESNLSNSIGLIDQDLQLKASASLISRYETQPAYNSFLIDEEKKLLAEDLLRLVQISENSTLQIYNPQQELIAYIGHNGDQYHLSYISHKSTPAHIMRRYANEQKYQRLPLQTLHDEGIDRYHTAYYSQEQVIKAPVMTYIQRDMQLRLMAHKTLTDQDGTIIAHVELTRVLDQNYFSRLSNDLNTHISLLANKNAPSAAKPLRQLSKTQNADFVLNTQNATYTAYASLAGINNTIYFKVDKPAAGLQALINTNRQQFLLLMAILAVTIWLVMHLVIKRMLETPLKRLMQQLRKIELQDYSPSQEIKTGDELQATSATINQLAATVHAREHSLDRSRSEMEHLSNHDVLTGLANRRLFTGLLEHAIELARRNETQLAVFFLDLDQFKQINDTLGHDTGDSLLYAVAQRLKKNTRNSDSLARIGGDEFNILIENITEPTHIETIARHYLDLFEQPFIVDGAQISISASIGIASYPVDGTDYLTLTKNADLAMYQAKESGRQRYCFFSSSLFEDMKARADMTRALKTALEAGDQFRLYYQPKVCPHTGQTLALEALIRWQSPQLGFVTPDRFIPLAEELGLILPLGEWILEQACYDFRTLANQGINLRQISVNVSNLQLSSNRLAQFIPNLLQTFEMQPAQLELEITESYIASDVDQAISNLGALRALGIELAIDDFGTGYSAMSYLQMLPINRLKIDKSFVDGVPHNPSSITLTRTVIQLAKDFDLKLTAEGVETDAQLAYLRAHGCDEIQGYLFARPMPLDELTAYIRQSHCISESNVPDTIE